MVPENRYVKEINVDEIYDFSVEQSPVVEQHTVKNTVNKVTESRLRE